MDYRVINFVEIVTGEPSRFIAAAEMRSLDMAGRVINLGDRYVAFG